MVLYESLVWLKSMEYITVRRVLNHIQGMTCLANLIVLFEAHLELPPLHLEVKAHARTTFLRLYFTGN